MKLKKYIYPFLTLFVLSLFAIYLYRNPFILTDLISVSPFLIILIMLTYIAVFFIEGLFILVVLKVFNRGILKGESFYIATLSRVGNFLLPMRAGAIFRATYLKKRFNFQYTNFLSTLYGYYIIFFLSSSLLAVLVLVLKWLLFSEIFISLTLFFIFVILAMTVLIFIRIPSLKILKQSKGVFKKVGIFLDNFLQGWSLIVKNRILFIELMIIAFANTILNTVIVYIEFISIGKVGHILDIILYTCLSGLSLLLSFTPGSLGIREGVFFLTSNSLGLTEQEIMKIAFLDRGIMFVLLFLCLIVISLFVKRFNLRELYLGKDEKR
jgi:uncharacterized protein (TIRG00374 family)